MGRYKAIFEELDDDESGELSASEYASFVGISEREAMTMMQEIDENSDGMMQFEVLILSLSLCLSQSLTARPEERSGC